MAGPLDGPMRAVAKTLTDTFGARVILRQPSVSHTPATGESATTNRDRVVRGTVGRAQRPDEQGVLRRVMTLTIAAEGLYEDGVWPLPETGDRVVVGADEIFGSDDNPGWTGGVEYRITGIEETWANEQVVSYELELRR